MHRKVIAVLAALAASFAVVVGAAGASPTTTVDGTAVVEGGNVILFDSGDSYAHQLRGADPGVTSALVALAGRPIEVYGSFYDNSPSSPILVQQFRVLPGGALNGETVTVTGPTQRLADGGVIVYDQYGNGHRLDGGSSTAIGEMINSLAGKWVTVTGTAMVTNPAGYITWPILVQSIAPAS